MGQHQTTGTKYATANAAPNYKSETIKEIMNLATATTSDRATTARMTETNTRLIKELQQTQQKLVDDL